MLSDKDREKILHTVFGGDAMQSLMAKIARDPTAVDGIIGLAVQESTMKEHVLTLLKGMQIGEGRR